MSKSLVLVLIASAIALCFTGTATASMVLPTDERYQYFEEIKALSSKESGLLITDMSAVYQLEEDLISDPLSSPTKTLIYEHLIFVLCQDKIQLLSLSTLENLGSINLANASTAIAISSSHRLYVASANNIYVFELSIGPDATNGGFVFVENASLNYKQERVISSKLSDISYMAVRTQLVDEVYYFGTSIAGGSGAFYFSESDLFHFPLNFSYGGSSRVYDGYYHTASDSLYLTSPNGIFCLALGGTLKGQITADYPLRLEASVFNGGLKSAHAITAFDGQIYVSDTSSGSVQGFEVGNLQFVGTVFCYKGSDEGFYNFPSSVAVAGGKVFIADTLNNRVEVISEGKSRDIAYDFHAPTAVAACQNGTLFVLDSSGTQILCFNSEDKLVFSKKDFGYLTDLTASLDGRLYASDALQRVIYEGGADGEFVSIDVSFIPSVLFHSNNKRILYVLDSLGDIYSYSGGEFSLLTDALSALSVRDFAVDHSGQIFAVTDDNKIYRWNGNDTTDITPALDGRNSTYAELSAINIAFENSEQFDYGDLILADAGKSRIDKISATDSGVQNIDPNDYVHPADESVEAMLVESGTRVYGCPFSPTQLGSIASGGFAVVVVRDLPDNDYFSAIVYQNNNSTVRGYVLKNVLQPAPTSAPPYQQGRILNADTPIYRYPLKNSEVLTISNGEVILAKSVLVSLLDFTEQYKDSTLTQFYKVSYEGATGYVHAVNVVSKYYIPISTMPVLNATVVTTNITGAILYDLVDGEYVPISEFAPIRSGTKVHVVGRFDTASDFTEVYIIDSNKSVLRFYMETKDLHSDALSVLQVLALVISGIIALTLIFIILLRRRLFFHRQT